MAKHIADPRNCHVKHVARQIEAALAKRLGPGSAPWQATLIASQASHGGTRIFSVLSTQTGQKVAAKVFAKRQLVEAEYRAVQEARSGRASIAPVLFADPDLGVVVSSWQDGKNFSDLLEGGDWKDAISGAGIWLRLGHDLLAALAGVAGSGRVGPASPRAIGSAWADGSHRLATSVSGQRQRSRQKGGERTGPNPTDRGRPGSKRHITTDANGIPLAVQLTAASVHDSRVSEDLIDAVPAIRQRQGRPRRGPAKLHADKAYDVPRCHEALRRRRIKTRIARRGVDSSERLGRHRWVVERTLAWFSRFRRLTVRYERRANIHQAFLSLAASLICWTCLHRWLCGQPKRERIERG